MFSSVSTEEQESSVVTASAESELSVDKLIPKKISSSKCQTLKKKVICKSCHETVATTRGNTTNIEQL